MTSLELISCPDKKGLFIGLILALERQNAEEKCPFYRAFSIKLDFGQSLLKNSVTVK